MAPSLSVAVASATRVLLCALLFAGTFAGPSSADEDTGHAVAGLGLRESALASRDMKGWKRPRKIVVLTDDAARVASLQDVARGVAVVGVRNRGEALAHIADADGLIGSCDSSVIEAAPGLRWIQSMAAGVETCLANPRVRNGDIVLTNMQRINGPNISEHVMALVLVLTRQINTYLAYQSEGKWDRHVAQKLTDLDGHTMLVVGLGGIGTMIAERAHAFGMHVIATRRSGHRGPGFVDYVGVADELPNLIGRADVVVDVAPLTPETTGLFNAALFARMKPGAYFINVGRGKSVVTDDLLAALRTGRLGGAGLDVVDPEPLPADHPLWHARNVVITPHVAGFSKLKRERAWLVIRENLRRYAAGDKLLSVVDPKRGY